MKDKTSMLLYYIIYTPFLLASAVFLNLIMVISVVLPDSPAIRIRGKRKHVSSRRDESDALENLYWIEIPKEDHSADDTITIPTPVFNHCETEYNCAAARPNPF
jgi:hypothetical protein